MINEMKKSFKAILYERVTSPLSGILILAWLIFNWKACLVLALGDDSIYKRIIFVQANYVNIYDNIYYPAFYSIVFILIYPWITLGPFYIWQRSNYIKSKIKNNFELQTPLTIEKSIELRKEMRQKEIEFTEMMSSKNTKQIELEAEILRLEKQLQESENKYLLSGTSINGKNNTDSDEQKWNMEYTDVYKNDGSFHNNLDDVLDGIANSVTIDTDSKKYCLAQGLITMILTGKYCYPKKVNICRGLQIQGGGI